MSSPERLGDNRRVFIAVVGGTRVNTSNKKENYSDIDKSNTTNYGHARRTQSGLAPLDSTRHHIPWHCHAVSPPALSSEPRKRIFNHWRRLLSFIFHDSTCIAFCSILCVNRCNSSCSFADIHRIVHCHILRGYPSQEIFPTT